MTSSSSLPEGYATLAVLERGAPNYNAWLGKRLGAHLGQRVLEVGAGIGTITREILPGRELVIALEAERAYADRLVEVFHSEPRVRVLHSRVEETDWAGLANERLDSVVLSNVLEHIEDDAAAIRDFRTALQPGGTIVILVPALPALFGTLDEAVGHHRRYMPASLRRVIDKNGFHVERLEWMNLLGIPGWLLNGRVLRRRLIPAGQLRVYDRIAPLLARVESIFRLPLGMSLLAVARAV
jgi:SAM-dependent methyltransferase